MSVLEILLTSEAVLVLRQQDAIANSRYKQCIEDNRKSPSDILHFEETLCE